MPDRARPRRGAREGHRPPRPEAREPLRHEGRPRQDPRLRPREADAGGRRWPADETCRPRPPATEPGVVLGTLGYMSPEQVRGRPADARSDIFSFGAILYEMLSGRARSSATPPRTRCRRSSARIRRIFLPRTGRASRPRSTASCATAWRRTPRSDSTPRTTSRFSCRCRRRTRCPGSRPRPPRNAGCHLPCCALGAIALLLAAALTTIVLRRPAKATIPTRVVRFAVPIPPGTTYAPGDVSRGLSISPDGTRLVVEAISNGRRRLFLRPLDSEKFTEIEGTIGASAHFWSPDSRFIAFFADGKVKKVPAAGGPAEELCPAYDRLARGVGSRRDNPPLADSAGRAGNLPCFGPGWGACSRPGRRSL